MSDRNLARVSTSNLNGLFGVWVNEVQGLEASVVGVWLSRQKDGFIGLVAPHLRDAFGILWDDTTTTLLSKLEHSHRAEVRVQVTSSQGSGRDVLYASAIRDHSGDWDVKIAAAALAPIPGSTTIPAMTTMTTTHEAILFYESCETQVHREAHSTPLSPEEIQAFMTTVAGGAAQNQDDGNDLGETGE
ncbi:unnamed protein product [Vitrella brassicaformis CCMP3155]|uniref:Uncharacterized protein n=2 Tax=Vitrella brassicaformis TaxID=1169539 RepID=A0A0G4GBZ2_VITBC|nr:unnamed protein product [Vitrella brassicaformis CCMP3155]|eukprot:CEM26677.1 unnamed protein product [Vitrella brassicaformis CCMP3155]